MSGVFGWNLTEMQIFNQIHYLHACQINQSEKNDDKLEQNKQNNRYVLAFLELMKERS